MVDEKLCELAVQSEINRLASVLWIVHLTNLIFFDQELQHFISKHYEDHHNLSPEFSNFSIQFKQYFALLRGSIVRIHRPARENSDLRNVNRKHGCCIFYSMWVKRVCCVSKISSDCRCQSKEIGISMEVGLLSVATCTRGFFLPLNSLNEKKNLWHPR